MILDQATVEVAATPLCGRDLRRIPLVRRMLDDNEVTLTQRAIDQDWKYQRVCNQATGWNPWSGQVFHGAHSALQDWLDRPDAPLRELNEGDLLLPEVMFAVHDYLHVWAMRMLQSWMPERGLGFGPITLGNAEELTFLTLLTEAAATAGVDYWYLSTLRIGRVLPVGSALRNLTVSYREEDLAEYRRGYPGLRVQDPSFFVWLCQLYTEGVAHGFGNDALRESPLTLRWIEKELYYGRAQREYTRSWLSHLSGDRLYPTRSALSAPVSAHESWKVSLCEKLGEALWQLVHDPTASPTPPAPDVVLWSAPIQSPFDARCDNLACLRDPRATLRDRGIAPGSFESLFAQAVSSLDFQQCGSALTPSLEALKRSESVELLFEVLGHYPKVPRGEAGPPDLFFLS